MESPEAARLQVYFPSPIKMAPRKLGRIMLQRRVAGREAVAQVVAGGVALALSSDRSPGAGSVDAGGLDVFFRSHLFGFDP